MIPTVYAMDPLPWQKKAARAILKPSGRYYAWAGGKGSGKSITLCWIACLLAHTRPGARLLLAMDTYSSLRDIHLPILRKMAKSIGGVLKGENDVIFTNGSEINLRYLDMPGNPEDGGSPIEGKEYHAVLADECQKVDSRYWIVFDERSRVSVKDVNGNDCDPLIILSGLPIASWWCSKTEEQGGQVWRPKTSDNNHNAPGYEARLRSQMTEARARAMLDGEELQQSGAIFQEYKRAIYPDGNLLANYKPNYATSRTILTADLGIRFPHALLMVQDDELGAWVVTREWAPDNCTIGELCRLIRKTAIPRREWSSQSSLIPIDICITDPAGQARSAQTGSSDLDIWAMNPPDGLGMRPVVEKDPSRRGVVEGVTRMQLAFDKKKLLFSKELIDAGTASPRDVRSIAKCLMNYSWDPKDPSRPNKDGFNDHGIDALRYGFREVLWNVQPLPNLYTGWKSNSMSVISDALSQARDNSR